MLFLDPINLNGNELQNISLQQLAADPTVTPSTGKWIYYNTTINAAKYWNGTSWIVLDVSQVANGTIPLAKLATDPLARANHTGTQLASTISDFSSATHAIVDPLISGLSDRQAVAYATTTALPSNTYANGTAGVGATLTATANAALAVDGATVQSGQRILVMNEATAANNGLYTVTQVGSGALPFILTRATDFDQSGEIGPGIMVPVEAPVGATAGATNNGKVFITVAAASFTVGTTSITFSGVGGTYTAGANGGLQLTSTAFSVLLPGSSGLVSDATGLHLDTTIAVRKFSQAIGDGSTTAITVTHNLGTQNINVSVRQAASPWAEVKVDNTAPTTNTATLTFAVAPTTGQYIVTITG